MQRRLQGSGSTPWALFELRLAMSIKSCVPSGAHAAGISLSALPSQPLVVLCAHVLLLLPSPDFVLVALLLLLPLLLLPVPFLRGPCWSS